MPELEAISIDFRHCGNHGVVIWNLTNIRRELLTLNASFWRMPESSLNNN